MEGRPECASESVKQKTARFADDVSAIGEELRVLLREIRKCYRHHYHTDHEYSIESAYDEWTMYGVNEWFEPLSSVERSVFDRLAEWASLFHRAVRVVDVSKAVEGFSSPLDVGVLSKLSQSLTPVFEPRVGNDLMQSFGALTLQLEAFTEAVDLWMFETQREDSAGGRGVVDQGKSIAMRASQFVQDPSRALADFREIIDGFKATFEECNGNEFGMSKIAVRADTDWTPIWLNYKLDNFANAMDLARKQDALLFERIDMNGLWKFQGVIRPTLTTVVGAVPFAGATTFMEAYTKLLRNYVDFCADVESQKLRRIGGGGSDARPIAGDVQIESNGSPVADHIEPLLDGPNELRFTFMLNGIEVGAFTPTEFDVVKLMWEHRERLWATSDAFFRFHQQFDWSQSSDSPFGKHQTAIKTRFREQGLELPWKRVRGSFKWLGWVRIRDGKES